MQICFFEKPQSLLISILNHLIKKWSDYSISTVQVKSQGTNNNFIYLKNL